MIKKAILFGIGFLSGIIAATMIASSLRDDDEVLKHPCPICGGSVNCSDEMVVLEKVPDGWHAVRKFNPPLHPGSVWRFAHEKCWELTLDESLQEALN